MKKLLLLQLFLMLSFVAFGQRRYHAENLTDRSVPMTANRMNKIGSRASAPLTCVGSPKVPVILVQFKNLEFKADMLMDENIEHSDANVNAFYDIFCNGQDAPDINYRTLTGSVGPVRDYFKTVSDGQFTPQFSIIGPVTLPNDFEYYGKDSSKDNKDVNITRFYQDALKIAIASGVDFSQFDNNNDGKTDFAFFIYAGEGQNAYGNIEDCKMDGNPEKANLIWPKEQASDFTVNVDGKQFRFGGYGCTNEIYGSRVDGIGTVCHELSHGLGLPDLYDTKYVAFGMDYFDLMDSGNYSLTGRCPVEYSGYERDFMGWRKLQTVDLSAEQTIRLEPIEKGGKTLKLVNPKNSNEYYLIENRQRHGYDLYFGWVATSHNGFKIVETLGYNHGLLVTHVDYSQSSWTSNSVNIDKNHQRMTVLPADGKLISSIDGYVEGYFRSIAGDLFPGSQNVTSIPANRFTLFSGGNLPVDITNIVQNDDLSMTIDFNGGDQTAIDEIIENSAIASDASTVYDLQGRCVVEPKHGIYIKGGKKFLVK